jgi:hypothetical protein
MRYTVEITESRLTEQATKHAQDLIDATALFAGLDLTARERTIVAAGIRIGISSTIAAIREGGRPTD